MPTHLSALQQLLMPTDGFNGFQGRTCPELRKSGVHSTKLEFQLHEGHAFRHDGESDEIVA